MKNTTTWAPCPECNSTVNIHHSANDEMPLYCDGCGRTAPTWQWRNIRDEKGGWGHTAPAVPARGILDQAARIAAAEEARFQEQYEADCADMIAEFESWLDERDRTRNCTHCDGTGVKELRLSGRLHDVTAVPCPKCREWTRFDNGGWEGADDDDPRYASDPDF